MLETQTKQEENKERYSKDKSAKIPQINRLNNVAKVKIILNYDKKKGNLSNDAQMSKTYKAKSEDAYNAISNHSDLERHLKSVSSQAK